MWIWHFLKKKAVLWNVDLHWFQCGSGCGTSKLQEKPSAIKREHKAQQNMTFFRTVGNVFDFSIFVSNFCLPGSGSGSGFSRPNQCGSEPDPQHWKKVWLRSNLLDKKRSKYTLLRTEFIFKNRLCFTGKNPGTVHVISLRNRARQKIRKTTALHLLLS